MPFYLDYSLGFDGQQDARYRPSSLGLRTLSAVVALLYRLNLSRYSEHPCYLSADKGNPLAGPKRLRGPANGQKRQSWRGWGSRPPDFGWGAQGCRGDRGRVVKYYYSLLFTGSIFGSGES